MPEKLPARPSIRTYKFYLIGRIAHAAGHMPLELVSLVERRDHEFDPVRREGVADGEHARAQNGGVGPGAGLGDLQMLGGEGIGAGVDNFAHSRDQVLAGLRHRPAEHDHGGVNQVDAHC